MSAGARWRAAATTVPAALAAALALTLAACGRAPVPNLDSPGSAIVCFGDSITHGTGAGPGEDYPSRLAARIGVPVVNAGVPGDTTREALARVDQVLAADPWLAIVELGGNDLLRRRPVEDAEADLAAILERLLAARVAVLLVKVEAPLIGGRYGAMYDRLAERFAVPMVEDALGDVLADPRRKSDQIHPNAAGYADLAEAVAESVEPLLAERRRLRLPVAPREAA